MEEESKRVIETKILGIYLLIASLLQVCLYVLMSLEKSGPFFYFDPRIGIYFIESGVRGSELSIPGVFQWFSALWLLFVAVMLLRGRLLLMTYVVSEMILLAPNLLFIALVVLANLSPAHGFSIPELFAPVLVMLCFSIVPLLFALFLIFVKHRGLV